MRGYSKLLTRGTAAVSLLLSLTMVTFSSQAANCERQSTSSTYWYQCDGVKVTQTINTTITDNSITDFRQVDNRVVWKYVRKSGAGTTTRTESAYYTNLISGGAINQFTQLATSSFSYDEAVQELQVVGNRAVWRYFDGERNCGAACRSNYAYYYACLSDANSFRITEIANQSLNTNESITNFNMNFSSNTATWKFFDGRRSNDRQEVLSSCTPQVNLGKPYPPNASVSGRNVNLTWNAVPNADNYEREVSVNGGSWKNRRVLTGTSKTYFDYAYGTYKYRIRACNNSGCGEWSNASNTVSVSASGLNAPSSVAASVSGRTVTLSWNAVTDADWYEREVSVNGGSWKNNYTLYGTSKVYYNYSYGTYKYRMRACNNNGCSNWSASSNTITVK